MVESHVASETQWFLIRLLQQHVLLFPPLVSSSHLDKMADTLGLFSASVLSSLTVKALSCPLLSGLSIYIGITVRGLCTGFSVSGHDAVLQPGRCTDIS